MEAVLVWTLLVLCLLPISVSGEQLFLKLPEFCWFLLKKCPILTDSVLWPAIFFFAQAWLRFAGEDHRVSQELPQEVSSPADSSQDCHIVFFLSQVRHRPERVDVRTVAPGPEDLHLGTGLRQGQQVLPHRRRRSAQGCHVNCLESSSPPPKKNPTYPHKKPTWAKVSQWSTSINYKIRHPTILIWRPNLYYYS